jgi:TonB family protein
VTPARPAIDPNLGQRLLAYAANLQLPGERINQLRSYILQRFGYSEAVTHRDVYNSNLKQWESLIQQQTGISDLTAEIDRSQLSITYQQRVCLRAEPGEARVGVLVNPDGSQRQEPVLLRSSGYAVLDQEAVELVKRHNFGPAPTLKAYTVPVKNRLDYGRQPCIGR